MYNLTFEWLAFRINLKDLHTWMKTNAGEYYAGMSAHSVLEIHFTADPGDVIQSGVEAKIQSLMTEGEAAKFTIDEDRELAIETAKTSILTATFDTLNAAERKILMGISLSDSDKDSLVDKHLGE